MSEQIQLISVQKRLLKTFAITKNNILQPISLQLSPLSPHAALLGKAKLWSKGGRAKEKSWPERVQSIAAFSHLMEGLSNNLLGSKSVKAQS